jgi:four helix bundle protein
MSDDEIPPAAAWWVAEDGEPSVPLETRTKNIALRILRLYESLTNSTAAQVLGKQVLRTGTSVGAHYRQARRGRSAAESVNKLEVAPQETDDTSYWLELLAESGIVHPHRLDALQDEAGQLTAILVACLRPNFAETRHAGSDFFFPCSALCRLDAFRIDGPGGRRTGYRPTWPGVRRPVPFFGPRIS